MAVVCKPKKRPYIEYAALKKRKKKKPTHKSKSVAALPYNRPIAATHMLFLPTRSLILAMKQFNT